MSFASALRMICGASALLGAAELQAQTLIPPDPAGSLERFRWYGESATYSIKILGTEAVRAGISVGFVSTDREFGQVIPVQIVGTTVGFFDTIYPIDNESLSLLGVHEGLRAVHTDSDFNERDYVSRFVMTYDRDDYHLSILRIRPDQPNEHQDVVIPRDMYDDLSMVFDLRGRDLAVGHRYLYFNHDGDSFDRFAVVVEGIEDVYSELGYISCYKLSWIAEPLESAPALPFGTSALPPTFRATQPPDEIAVSYVSVDERRLLVGGDIPTDIGLMTIRMTSITSPSADYIPPVVEP